MELAALAPFGIVRPSLWMGFSMRVGWIERGVRFVNVLLYCTGSWDCKDLLML